VSEPRAFGRHSRPLILFCVCAGFLFAVAANTARAATLNPLGDGVALGLSAGFAGASELLIRFAEPLPATPRSSYETLSTLDLQFLFPYSRSADIASSVLEVSAMATPIAMSLADDPNAFLGDAIAYAESFGVALGLKNFVKYLLPKYRPYVYEGGAVGVDPSEDNQAFPSGHTTMAFTAAAFSTYLYLEGLPRSASLLPFVVANYALAGLTASYRVLSGMHFVTDVLAGAAIGMICGLAIPAMFRPVIGAAR
jgi:membrane-associated phospholipid phosphatase